MISFSGFSLVVTAFDAFSPSSRAISSSVSTSNVHRSTVSPVRASAKTSTNFFKSFPINQSFTCSSAPTRYSLSLVSVVTITPNPYFCLRSNSSGG